MGKPPGHVKAADKDYPIVQRLKRIELAFKERSFLDFNFLVGCETGKDELACGRNLLITGKAPECNQLVTDKDKDGVCDKLDDCPVDPKNQKDPKTGLCLKRDRSTCEKGCDGKCKVPGPNRGAC